MGICASIASMLLWVVFVFLNPYSHRWEPDAAITTFILLFLPACIALAAVAASKRAFMAVAFIWSFPGSLYTAMTPSIFALFGVTSLAYLFTFVLMRSQSKLP
ncbi:hypothetical protein SD70_18575 [Gordoniibacillus kamchatkensis]|uniref:Uncharacterized protein n=1 Tax=Gordoniibacillus kamchatkensis TaxID=1590651 RepID=A0ABR5AFC9_9BACL|nr:hypothetical protein SD70_18575 [Paenibacillus sp. VKM B-2647]